ncbi:MAG: putative transport system permease protein [Acidimicrobiaceae bacterium]|jgi:putative ABC transport system permease protein
MWKVTVKGLLAHKTRFVSTFIAILLGISFLTGTFVLSDTIKTSFNDLFASVSRGTDAYVRDSHVIKGEEGNDQRRRLDDSLVSTVKSVDVVADAQPDITENFTQIVGSDGKALGTPGRGAPTFGANWIENPRLEPFKIFEGAAPSADDHVVIDRGSAKKGHLKVGDTITVLLPKGPPTPFHLVGIAKFGTADSPLGASFALFTLPTAERVLTEPGKIGAIKVQAKPGVSQQQVTGAVQKAMPAGIEVVTGEQITKENQNEAAQSISQFTIIFSAFSSIALIVGGFVIYNTFSIIVAQRTREMALLRAIGAGRRQVITSVVLEALAVGVIASGAGILGGIAVAAGLKALFSAFGFDLPATGLIVTPATVIVGLTVGIVVTTVAAVAPAVRASRVPPIAALRESAAESVTVSVKRIAAGAVSTALGMGIVFWGVFGTAPLGLVILGALFLIAGTVLIGPLVARPMSAVLGQPAAALCGVTGKLAQENAMRNPRRTSNTASALLIGVGVVSLLTVLYASFRQSIDDRIQESFIGDVTITAGAFGNGGVSPDLESRLRALPEVEVAAPERFATADVDGSKTFVTAIDPVALPKVLNLNVREGNLADLGTDKVAVQLKEAKAKHWKVGESVKIRFAETGEKAFTIAAIFDRQNLASDVVVSTATFDANVPNTLDAFIFVKFKSGVPLDQARAAVEAAAKPFANAKVQDQSQLKQEFESNIQTIFAMVLVLLTLSIGIALLGIANTLRLSVYERIRELGLLRAIGMTRSQVRSALRWESMIIALFGTLGGMVLGLFFGWAAVQGISKSTEISFVLPIGLLITIAIVGALAGVLAAIRPASRAAKLDLLQAIATE